MNLLFTGRGTSGSWIVRGQQLSAACDGTAKPNATQKECRAADIIVAVKRMGAQQLAAIQSSGKPWVLDVVDMYPQPACTAWSRENAIAWVKHQLKAFKPTGVIWPNQRMKDDCDSGIHGMVLPHHYRPDIAINPIREQVKTVGYEGSARYIGEWLEPITKACNERGWQFVVNPDALADLDIVIAARGSEFNGYAQRHWKSNVKLANAHGSGTPFIGPRECGYQESRTGLEQWCDSPDELPDCLDRLSEQYHRQTVQQAFMAQRYSVADASHDLRAFLETI